GYTTVQININLVRAITQATGTIRAEASVIHSGRQVATAEARLTDSRGKLLAHATTTCAIFPLANT
ncbi:MAG: PaaI family thioesterase, partial [Anaerolineae bacterium]|nr:PaaI family thioesterase [Anaerolineae bacterium]